MVRRNRNNIDQIQPLPHDELRVDAGPVGAAPNFGSPYGKSPQASAAMLGLKQFFSKWSNFQISNEKHTL
jgi:hypothetical protein